MNVNIEYRGQVQKMRANLLCHLVWSPHGLMHQHDEGQLDMANKIWHFPLVLVMKPQFWQSCLIEH